LIGPHILIQKENGLEEAKNNTCTIMTFSNKRSDPTSPTILRMPKLRKPLLSEAASGKMDEETIFST